MGIESSNLHGTRHGRVAALALIAAVTGCSRSSNAPSAAGITPFPSADRSLVATTSTYDVALKPDTRVIDAAVMRHAYRGTGKGGTLEFDAASAPAVAALTPGTVAIFAGVAMLNVSNVSRAGAVISVAGTAAGLEDAIENGHIEWSAPLDFKKVVFNPPPGFHRVTDESHALLGF